MVLLSSLVAAVFALVASASGSVGSSPWDAPASPVSDPSTWSRDPVWQRAQAEALARAGAQQPVSAVAQAQSATEFGDLSRPEAQELAQQTFPDLMAAPVDALGLGSLVGAGRCGHSSTACHIAAAPAPSGQVVSGTVRFVRAPLVSVERLSPGGHPQLVAYLRVSKPLRDIDTTLNGHDPLQESPAGFDAYTHNRRCVEVPLSMGRDTPASLEHARVGTRVRLRLTVFGRDHSDVRITVRLRKNPHGSPIRSWFDALGCPHSDPIRYT